MEKKIPEKQGSGISFTPVTTNYVVAGGQNRLPSVVSVKKSGLSRTSAESTGLIWENLSQFPNVTRENLHLWFGVDAKGGNIAIYLAEEAPGLIKVRDWGTTLGFHLGGVFKEHPKLRPNTEVECALRFDSDANGKPCFIFNIMRGLAKKREPVEGGRPEPAKKTRQRRKKTDPSAPGEAAAGQA